MGRQRLELVRRGDEGNAGNRGDAIRDSFGEADRRVEAGADGGAALRQFLQAGQRQLDALDRRGDLGGIAREFLAEGQGVASCVCVRPILMMCAKALVLASSALCRCFSAGKRSCTMRSAQAMCMAVG